MQQAQRGNEVLGNLFDGPWVPGKQGQSYLHVCIYLHEDELLPGSIHNTSEWNLFSEPQFLNLFSQP